MEYRVLYRKYRSKDFNDLVGQEPITKTLKNSIINNKISHAYIFTGPRGTGKTSTAKIFAAAINCENRKDGNPCGKCSSCTNIESNPDIIEMDAASNNGVDEIRELINNVKISPSYSKYKVYIIDEVHMLTGSAFNALLLTLEEPPEHIVFILATTDIQNVPVTVLSRCQRFDFRKLKKEDIVKRLKTIIKEEKVTATDEALEEIALMSDGALRDALSILDQLIDSDDKKITIEDVIDCFGSVSITDINNIIQYLETNDAAKLVELLDKISKSSTDHRVFIEKLIEALKNTAVEAKITGKYKRLDYIDIKNLIFDLNDCIANTKLSVNPYILIEITLLNYIKDNMEEKETVSIPVKEETKVTSSNIEIVEDKKVIKEKKAKKENISDDLVDIRVNNCFVNAQKTFLKEVKSNWKDLISNIKKTDKKMLSLLIDSEIVAASDSHAIISSSETNSLLINDDLESIEEIYKDLFKQEYKIIAISAEKWQEEKQKYIDNIKKDIKYNLIEEKIKKKSSKSSELESVAQDLFGDKLEIE